MPYTLTFHRVLKAPPARVFKAFTDAAALNKWLPPAGFTGHVDRIDAKPGGTYHMSFMEMDSGHVHSFGGTYTEFKPGEKLVRTDTFDDKNLPGEIRVTAIFKKVSCGTDLLITQEGVPDAIPQDMCNLGWQDSLKQLAQLVERG